MHRVRGYLPDFLELPDLPIPRRVTQFLVGPSESSAQPRKRQRRAAGFSVWGWHDFELSESPNNRARIFGTISNFPSFSTCSCELFGQEIELSESTNIESSGSRLGRFNFLPFSASPMYLPPESSVSCHLHETAGARRRPRVLPLPRSCTNARAPAPVPSPKTKAGRGLCPVPPFCVPISQQAAFVGAPAAGWFSGAVHAFWLRPASDCWPLCQLCGPLVTGHRAGRHPPCRLPAACALLTDADLQLAACALLAGAGLQLAGLTVARPRGPRNRPQTTYLRMTFWPLSSSLRAQWPQWYSASASDTVPSPNIKRCVPR